MTNARQRLGRLAGLAGLGIALAAWRVYNRRARARVVSHEGLDAPDVARAFNRVATLPHMRLLRWFVARRAVAMAAVGQAVDLGCGPGHLVVELAQAAPGLRVTGVDLSDEMLAEAERYARRAGLPAGRVAFKKGDVARIPFPDGSLDLVVSTLSLHHWRDPVGVLDEVARVLRPPDPAAGRPGGAFLVFDLRRDMTAPFYLLLWFATRCVVPGALRRVNEPLGSRDAAFTVGEAADLAAQSHLTGWRVSRGPLWLMVEGSLQ
ncbi:MAG: class I SAM-dependent methyltransferase [Anaerolineae bacterium]|jgi:ubiquinone/menaquinone biosynthesis C-methylase UbiE